MAQTSAIEIKNLRKSFGKVEVLKGVSFNVREGSVLALLGPNGAGKTTTIKILATLLAKDGGTAKVNGYDVVKQSKKVRASIGLTGQFAAVDEYLTGRENIRLIGDMYHMDSKDIQSRSDELLEKLDLVDAADRPAKTYSGGMKRRLDLAMSLVSEPSVIFLDEPTTGLDPRSRIALWEMIKSLAKSGTTILLTTQYMDEADFLAENIIVIDRGVVIAEGTPLELKTRAGADKVVLTFNSTDKMEKAAKLLGAKADESSNSISLSAKQGMTSLKKVLADLESNKLVPDTAALAKPTLDDVFLALTGHSATEDENQEAKK